MDTVFLALDYMVGVADQPYAANACRQAVVAVGTARENGIPVIFTKVGFRPGHPEVSDRNPVFGPLLGTDRLVGASSRLVDGFLPGAEEPVLDKKRFSALSGSGLWTILHARRAASVVLCGLSTSGVVLSTSLELVDADVVVTILSDACADPDASLDAAVLHGILAKRATVRTIAEWSASLARDGKGR